MRAGIRSAALMGVLAGAIGAGAAAADDPAAEAKAALAPTLVRIVAAARDEGTSAEEKRAVIEHELAIWLDYSHMLTVALGPRIEMFSRQQLAEFSQEFDRYITDLYIRRVVRFREKEIEIEEASLDAESGVVTVRTLGGAPLGVPGVAARRMWKPRADVDYLLRRRHGEWRIVGVRIEGVDISLNFREQFREVLERSDPDALIAELRKRNAEREAQNPFG